MAGLSPQEALAIAQKLILIENGNSTDYSQGLTDLVLEAYLQSGQDPKVAALVGYLSHDPDHRTHQAEFARIAYLTLPSEADEGKTYIGVNYLFEKLTYPNELPVVQKILEQLCNFYDKI